ncbi:hypothetical protein K0B96_14405 [Horticoccus luteus]|uniref:Uncharacterized protein n=1 Tax=Horticoccus luteus TaxID=2862869 RepID=A0A8F9TUT1_9BACT|nr:hypothetical protein [Horticoccus luteus]QYM78477.1 hypothetical protein K0B96_14405 [Horticoccus luteus]
MHVLRNGFWRVVVAAEQPRVAELQFDAWGEGKWCANLLKTGAPRSSHLPLTGPVGAQSVYVDASGNWRRSGESLLARLSAGRTATEVTLGEIEFGAVRETWRLRLDGARLTWTIRQEWKETVEVADALTPGLFFAAEAAWGEATVFQLWERGMAGDGFYGNGTILGTESVTAWTRQTRREGGGWVVAKLLSHAVPNGDWRVATSHHLKKGEILNFASVLGQSAWCDAAGPRTFRAGEVVETEIAWEPAASETGMALGVEVERGATGWREAEVTRRFFDVYANCGIMADTQLWRLGNQPAGYVALFCRYMQSEMLKFGVPRGALGPASTDGQDVLVGEVTRMAENLRRSGTVGAGYQSSTSLDFYPSFLVAMRDVLVVTGDRESGAELWAGAEAALARLRAQLAEGGGLISTARETGNDYWDWIARTGHIGYVNILAWMGLRAASEVARWLGREDEAAAAERDAAAVGAAFNAEFWSEEKGFYADWVEADGRGHFYLYAPPQLMAICAGMVPEEKARRVVAAILARRHELGPAWENCFSIQTNFYDAETQSFMFRTFGSDVTRFGQTMNGGCLASWNYHWIGALMKTGHTAEAVEAWRRVVARFEQTALVEGCNYWDYQGEPSRTMIPVEIPGEFPSYDLISAEPFLADQGLVAAALPRWLLGVEPTLEGVKLGPVAAPELTPAQVTLRHLGEERVVEVGG